MCACAALGARIEVIQSRIEDLDLAANSVDVLISEPMGTLLVNERMLETYLHARDRFLKPGGRMFPVCGNVLKTLSNSNLCTGKLLYSLTRFTPSWMQQIGRIHVAAFTDDLLYTEMVNKATFWQQSSFFGVDLSSLFQPALDGYFSQASPLQSPSCTEAPDISIPYTSATSGYSENLSAAENH